MQSIIIFLILAIILGCYYYFFNPDTHHKTLESPKKEIYFSSNQPKFYLSKNKNYLLKRKKNQKETSISSPSSQEIISKTKKETKKNISPYFGKIKIGEVSSFRLSLLPQYNSNEKINISGWKIKGKRIQLTIPKGISLFLPGTSQRGKDIYLKSDERFLILNEKNPFKINLAFKKNKCFGYLADDYNLGSLSSGKICPPISQKEICHFSQDCRNLISQLTSCQKVNYSDNLKISFDSSCQKFIENYIAKNLNYEGCIQNYYKDKDFLGKTWYFYFGHNITCRCEDTIYLYDKNGLLVDKYYYEIY